MSRSSDIVATLQQRRAERKKPRRVKPLKQMSLDAGQQSAVSQAQAQPTSAPMSLQKTAGRNSTALTVSVAFHVIIALLISIFYITDRIVSETETIDGVLVVEEHRSTRRIIRTRPKQQFETKRQETQKNIARKPVQTTTTLPLGDTGFTIDQAPDAAVDVPEPSTTGGLKALDFGKGLERPTGAEEVEIKPLEFAPERSSESLLDKVEPLAVDDAPDLNVGDINVGPKGTHPKFKFKSKPDYPQTAKRAGKEGTVILQATIDENGIAQDIVAVTSLGFGFEDAAIAALRKSTFIPATQAGKPVSKRVKIPFEFTLED